MFLDPSFYRYARRSREAFRTIVDHARRGIPWSHLAVLRFVVVLHIFCARRGLLAHLTHESAVASSATLPVGHPGRAATAVHVRIEEYMAPKDFKKANKSGPPLGKYYSPKNTIMFDDVARNFLMNPENGLRIKPFRDAITSDSRQTDVELRDLADLLDKISSEPDFSKLDLKHWRKYL